MHDKVYSLKNLNIYDKDILYSAIINNNPDICKNMSIFSKEGLYLSCNQYKYFKTTPGTDIYYIGMTHIVDCCVFIDYNKKIIYNSRFWSHLLSHFIDYIDKVLEYINSINLNIYDNIIDIGINYISNEKWFITYGHYLDEACNIYDFSINLKGIDDVEYKFLLDYTTDNNIIKHYSCSTNYIQIEKYLFGENSINAYIYNNKIIKLQNLCIVEHRITYPSFHAFYPSARNKILKNIDDAYIYNKNVFITRGIATHLPRNLANQEEIESFFISNNYIIINPETVSYEFFINNIRHANRVVLTWGGALTNMIYLKENADVIILKSLSYAHENIELFRKIIDTYKLNIKIIEQDGNNYININSLSFLKE
jgi:hypothetical protein